MKSVKKILITLGVVICFLVTVDISLVSLRQRAFQNLGLEGPKQGDAHKSEDNHLNAHHERLKVISENQRIEDQNNADEMEGESKPKISRTPTREEIHFVFHPLNKAPLAVRAFGKAYGGVLRGLESVAWLVDSESAAGLAQETGLDMIHRGNFEMARKYLQFAVEKEKDPAIKNYYKGTLAWVVESPSEAQQLLEESCSVGSQNLRASLDRAIRLCTSTENHELKEMYLERLRNEFPDYAAQLQQPRNPI